MRAVPSVKRQYILALIVASFVSVGFFTYAAWRNHSLEFDYLIWNLFLAWVPLVLAYWLVQVLKTNLWSSWQALSISALWILFLPNSFYMISDFIHLQDVSRVDLLYDALMFTSFIFTGVILGITSLLLIHVQLKKRLSRWSADAWIVGTLLLCSFAIYVGRDLRWNSWDVLANPAGLLFDISDRLLHPAAYPQMFVTVISFFILLTTIYGVVWRGIHLARQQQSID